MSTLVDGVNFRRVEDLQSSAIGTNKRAVKDVNIGLFVVDWSDRDRCHLE